MRLATVDPLAQSVSTAESPDPVGYRVTKKAEGTNGGQGCTRAHGVPGMVRFRQQFGRARVYVGTVRTASTPPADQWEARLDRIAELPRGWDSYNADPPSEQAVEAARAFLRFLRRGGRAPRSLNPSVVGGVGITFRRAERTVYIEFRNTGNAHAAFADEAPEPEVVRVRQDATGFAEVVAKAENFLNEQAARRDEG